MKFKRGLLAVALCGASSAGMAQNMARPGYTATPVAVGGNLYVWVDGTYNRVRLPSSSLGLHVVGPGAAASDNGPIQTFENRLDGAGVRGAIGYVMPGTTMRFELGGSYVSADGSSQQVYTTPQRGIDIVLLSGGASGAFVVCSAGGASCLATGSHRSDYDAWEINGKAKWDVTWGSVLLSPSLAVFGGNSRNREGLSQTLDATNGNRIFNYQASTRLRWTDYGGRAGLDGRFPVFGAWTIDVGGWIGVAQRNVSLNGSDIVTGDVNRTSSISVDDDRAVFLANAEAGLSYKFNPSFTFRGFAGLNYDNKVPGISSPTFSGSAFAVGGGTPAGITYSSETSYYAGGGVLLKF